MDHEKEIDKLRAELQALRGIVELQGQTIASQLKQTAAVWAAMEALRETGQKQADALGVVSEVLLGGEGRRVNEFARLDALMRAVLAAIEGRSPNAAYREVRDAFKAKNPGLFDATAWGEVPDWLVKARRK